MNLLLFQIEKQLQERDAIINGQLQELQALKKQLEMLQANPGMVLPNIPSVFISYRNFAVFIVVSATDA
jgi:hypothetical protein